MFSSWAMTNWITIFQSSGVNWIGLKPWIHATGSVMGEASSRRVIACRMSKVSDRRSKPLVSTSGCRRTWRTAPSKPSKSPASNPPSVLSRFAISNCSKAVVKSSSDWYFKASKIVSMLMIKCNHATGRAFKISSKMLSKLPIIFGDRSDDKLSQMSRKRMPQARNFSNVKTERSFVPWPSSMKSPASCNVATRRMTLDKLFLVTISCKASRSSSIPSFTEVCFVKLSNIATAWISSQKQP
mmetsp:Transcript_106121/g.307041  ORF Transcript_106121/g.307041 Transcript_106121/m.307041 type:complete len:241 (-) Transcript_106121:1915-2637(-)